MKPECPNCRHSAFTYRALLAVHPYPGELTPARIPCPKCGNTLRVTTGSRLLASAALFVLLVVAITLMSGLAIELSLFQAMLVSVGTFNIYFLAVWPLTVRLEPWSEFQYWLPRSRLLGYTVYLIIPVSLLVLLFCVVIGVRGGI